MRSFKNLFFCAAVAMTTGLCAQEKSPVFEVEGELIKGIFYYEDGSVRQEGTYKNGRLHGQWISYGPNGKKNALAEYNQGQKTGKWFFWTNDDVLKEVNYSANKIADVKTYKNTTRQFPGN